ncbi:MAG TPA: 4-hydroxy-tetrahydrodipicolinate synthase [Acidimicrobiales bacterium]
MIRLDDGFLRGSLPPLVTPFRDGAVDYTAYESLVEHHVRSGSSGVVVAGTTGEPALLSVAERRSLLEAAVSAADGRITVIAATGAPSHADTVELTEHAAAAGADAVLVVTPAFTRPPRRGLLDFFADVAARVELPFLVYHIPGRAAVSIDAAFCEELAERSDRFCGVKHASTDLGFVTDVLVRLGPEFRVLVGLEELSFPMLALGAAGTVNAVANVDPVRVAALSGAVDAGDLAGARRLHYELAELNRAVFFEMNPICVKYMCRRVGVLERNEHRLPLVPASPELEARLDGVLARAGLISDEEEAALART